MTALQILGAIMVASPLVGVFVLIAKMTGWRAAVETVAGAFAVAAVVIIGCWLVRGGT